MTHRYAFCGDVVESAISLPELVPMATVDSGAAATWRCEPGSVPADAACEHVHQWFDPDGELWLRISRGGGAYRLAFSAGAQFIVDGLQVRWEADPSVPVHTIRHLLLDQVLPLALSGRGAAVFHGASVAIGGAAVLFVGPSGSGKSTLAGWCAAAGDEFLADDCVRVYERDGMWMAQAAYPALRVWPDSAEMLRGGEEIMPIVAHYSRKVRVNMQPPSQSVLPLRRVYLLRPASTVEPLVRPSTSRTVVDLTRYLFRIDIARRCALAEDFDRTSRLVQDDLVRDLGIPASFAGLARVRRAVLADLHAADAGEYCA